MKTSHQYSATLAGAAAVSLGPAGKVLYEAGGRKIVNQGGRRALEWFIEEIGRAGLVRAAPRLATQVFEETATQVVSTGSVLARSGADVVRSVRAGFPAASSSGARAAVGQVAAGVGRAAGVGVVIDGTFGAVEAARQYRTGDMDGGQACRHVAKEAGTGAAASAVGVVAGVTAVAVVGTLSAPAVFTVGFLGAVGTKLGLLAVLS